MKFCLDPRHSPDGILTGHSANKSANLLINPGASDPASSGLPAPVALPMPFDNVSGLTMTRIERQSRHRCDKATQNKRSRRRSPGRFVARCTTSSCWRRARFSVTSKPVEARPARGVCDRAQRGQTLMCRKQPEMESSNCSVP